jgi:hypothetical protein
MSIQKGVDNAFIGPVVMDRLRGGKGLFTSSTSAEDTRDNFNDYNIGFGEATSADSNFYSWMWKRASSFMDVVAYTGDGVAGRTVSHNLGVAPEMMWIKDRSSVSNWAASLLMDASGYYVQELNNSYSSPSPSSYGSDWLHSQPTDTAFYVTSAGAVNTSGKNYIAYLFASLDGISKVGSVTIQSGSTTVDCGFSSGPRFVLLKRTDGASSWNLFDSERGIVAGNDPYLNLNQTAAEITGNDLIDPTSSGFTLTSLWTAGQTWIYYAIA